MIAVMIAEELKWHRGMVVCGWVSKGGIDGAAVVFVSDRLMDRPGDPSYLTLTDGPGDPSYVGFERGVIRGIMLFGLGDQMTGYEMLIDYLCVGRLVTADFFGNRAARVKATTGRWI